MISARVVWIAAIAGCTAEVPSGIAYIRLTESTGACGIVDAADASPERTTEFIAQLTELPYRRVHATAAFQGSGLWSDGHNIAMPWRDEDGTISRFFVDIGPNRGYGVSILPNTSSLVFEQAAGLVQWQGTERRFAGLEARGYVAYGKGDDLQPSTLFGIVAFDGVGPANEPLCRVVAVHATTTHERFEDYDPTWLAPDPSVMIVDRERPTLADDAAPGDHRVAPANAAADPGGVPPLLEQHAPFIFSNGASGGGACD
jgi:hypothetical protein